jgi:hypothetical protein
LAFGKISADCIGIVALVGKQGLGSVFWQTDQRVIGLAVCCLADRQVEGERSPEGISQAVKLTGEPAPRAAKSASMSPPFPPAAETWARTVVLSMLKWPLSAMISASVTATVSQTPASLHRRNRR